MAVEHWAVTHLLITATLQGKTVRDLERAAGLGQNTISRWKLYGRSPRIDELERALASVGLRLTVVAAGAMNEAKEQAAAIARTGRAKPAHIE